MTNNRDPFGMSLNFKKEKIDNYLLKGRSSFTIHVESKYYICVAAEFFIYLVVMPML
jgi:hypothetical protein